MNKQIEKIKDCIDSVYGSDCAYYGVDGLAIAAALYKAGCRFQSEKFLVKENGDIVPITPRSEWISVEDRLPQVIGKYICCVKNKDGNTWTITADYSPEMKTWFGQFGEVRNTVTHWMPLPEPPKGGE